MTFLFNFIQFTVSTLFFVSAITQHVLNNNKLCRMKKTELHPIQWKAEHVKCFSLDGNKQYSSSETKQNISRTSQEFLNRCEMRKQSHWHQYHSFTCCRRQTATTLIYFYITSSLHKQTAVKGDAAGETFSSTYKACWALGQKIPTSAKSRFSVLKENSRNVAPCCCYN